MKMKHHQPAFSFKPRQLTSIKKDYDAIFTDILKKSTSNKRFEDINLLKQPCSTSRLTSKNPLSQKKAPPRKKTLNEQIHSKLTTTEFITIYHRSVFVPTVIAVLPNQKIPFEKKSKLNEERNKRLLDKSKGGTGLPPALSESQADKSPLFSIDKLSGDLNDLTVDLHHNTTRSEYLSASFSFIKALSKSILNEIRLKHKLNPLHS